MRRKDNDNLFNSHSSIMTVDLEGNIIVYDRVYKLIEALKVNNSISIIDLGRINIGYEEVQALVFALNEGYFPFLTTLNLSDKSIEVAGIKALVTCLETKNLPSLTNLDLGVAKPNTLYEDPMLERSEIVVIENVIWNHEREKLQYYIQHNKELVKKLADFIYENFSLNEMPTLALDQYYTLKFYQTTNKVLLNDYLEKYQINNDEILKISCITLGVMERNSFLPWSI